MLLDFFKEKSEWKWNRCIHVSREKKMLPLKVAISGFFVLLVQVLVSIADKDKNMNRLPIR